MGNVAYDVSNDCFGELLSETVDIELLRDTVEYLWQILDNIDNASEIAEDDENFYRKLVDAQLLRRLGIIKDDGSNLFIM
ncbi:MAG: hypothetical protein GY861_22450 [bacterium]|nr:hypothetical protein [bacterium]